MPPMFHVTVMENRIDCVIYFPDRVGIGFRNSVELSLPLSA